MEAVNESDIKTWTKYLSPCWQVLPRLIKENDEYIKKLGEALALVEAQGYQIKGYLNQISKLKDKVKSLEDVIRKMGMIV